MVRALCVFGRCFPAYADEEYQFRRRQNFPRFLLDESSWTHGRLHRNSDDSGQDQPSHALSFKALDSVKIRDNKVCGRFETVLLVTL